ncbi:MAG: hypothetical protein QM831_42110 [Kofleriaceae bacterium]
MDRVSEWLIAKLDERQPYGTQVQLGMATELAAMIEKIATGSGMVDGMSLGAKFDRAAVLARGTEIMTAWLPHLTAPMLKSYAAIATAYSLPIDITPYLADAEKRDVEQAKARVAAELEQARVFREARLAAIAKEHNPALEAALGDDPEPYSVYADWLEAQGSPRGELIHLMLFAERERTRVAQDAVDACLDEHRAALIGELPDQDDGATDLTWRRGFIDELSLDDYNGIEDTLELVLAHPSARRLRSLVIGLNGEPTFDSEHGTFLPALVRAGPAYLERLHIGAIDSERCEISWYNAGDLSLAWKLPALRTLILRAGAFSLGEIDAPKLEHLELVTGGMTSANIDAIAEAEWPALARLDVYFGGDSYGGDTTIEDVHRLLAGDYPALRHLGLMNCPFADEAVEALVGSKLAAQLEVVDLSLGCLGPHGVDVLMDHRKRFRALKKLIVSRSYLDTAPVLAGVEVVADRLQGAAALDDRYVSISE